MSPSIADTVSGVRSGTTTAREVLEVHLAAIDERENEIHAFNLVLAERALDRRCPRSR